MRYPLFVSLSRETGYTLSDQEAWLYTLYSVQSSDVWLYPNFPKARVSDTTTFVWLDGKDTRVYFGTSVGYVEKNSYRSITQLGEIEVDEGGVL